MVDRNLIYTAQPVLIMGCGDVGRRLGKRLVSKGQPVVGVVRTQTSGARLKSLGIEPQVLDLDQIQDSSCLPTKGARVFYLAPPPPRGTSDPYIENFLNACVGAAPRCIVYLSTSGVYGDCRGAWVDEYWPTDPQTDRAKRRLSAERTLHRWRSETQQDIVVLRVGGIYGPERLPVARLSGMRVICPDEAPPSNRIHIEDLVTVCLAAMESGEPAQTYNVADDAPTSMTDYLYHVADWAKIPRPPCVSLVQAPGSLSPEMLSFIQESRRLINRKMKEVLGVRLQYPDLASGLQVA